MNAAEVVRRIYRERQEWRGGGNGPEVSWTCRGLDRALEIVRCLAKEERIHNAERRPRLSRWLAGDLYRAVRQALDYIKRGDRSKGIRTLEDAIGLVKEATSDLQLPR